MTDLERLTRIAAGMEPDALAVLLYQAERMAAGRIEHGLLDLAANPTDWRLEQLMELADFANYRAMQGIIAERKREAADLNATQQHETRPCGRRCTGVVRGGPVAFCDVCGSAGST